MKIKSIKQVSSDKAIKTTVGIGYIQGSSGSLPDVDIDFQSDRRQDVKEYLERRYNIDGMQRVFSVGTFADMKPKSLMKDIARLHGVPVQLVNQVTKSLKDDNMSWSDLLVYAFKEKQDLGKRKLLYDFVHNYPQVISDMRYLVGQPKSAGIHASALIITPVTRENKIANCYDFIPLKTMNGMLVSEIDGYSADNLGLLKNDVLGVAELEKLKAMLKIVKDVYGEDTDIASVANGPMDYAPAFEVLRKGFTQNVFQFASSGMTKFLEEMQPTEFSDLVAATSLYRPASLESGSSEKYNDCKHGIVEPVYLWGTYNILKETYGVLCYQEQLAQMAREIGGFTIGEGVNLVKLISKKKTDKIHAMKGKFMDGSKAKGCPSEDAEKIWDMIESGGSYLFNKCISGDEKIYRTHGGKWMPTISEMYKIKNDIEYAKSTNHVALRTKYINSGYGYGYSLNEDGRLIKNTIKDIRFEGITPIYRITLSDGKTLDVTSNHKHPTKRGMVTTDRLLVGLDMMFVNVGHISQDTVYRFTDAGVNNPDYHKSDDMVPYILNSKSGTEGFTDTPSSHERAKLVYYKKHIKGSCCEKCGRENCRLEVHHINGNHAFTGNNYENLETLCSSCHKKEHYKMGRKKQGERGLYTETRVVVSVDFIKNDEVYDVEMNHPYHTFATSNGVVTCNSHATAYSVSSYLGAYIKAKYPIAFYTVALQYADKDDLPDIMSEISVNSATSLVAPDINKSSNQFYADHKLNKIYWSLPRIAMVGVKASSGILSEREMFGEYTSIENFIDRLFIKKKIDKMVFDLRLVTHPLDYGADVSFNNGKEARKYFEEIITESGDYAYVSELIDDKQYTDEQVKFINDLCAGRNPVTSQHVKNLIFSGCFDEVEGVSMIEDRWKIMQRASEVGEFELDEKVFEKDLVDKHYFWSMKQVEKSGIGNIDYKRIYNNSDKKDTLLKSSKYVSLEDMLDPDNDGKTVRFCATLSEVKDFPYNSKKYGPQNGAKVVLMQNQQSMDLTIWADAKDKFSDVFNVNNVGKIIIGASKCQYNDWRKNNTLSSSFQSNFYIQE